MELLFALALLSFACLSSIGTHIIVNRIAQKEGGGSDPNGASDYSIAFGSALALGGYLADVIGMIAWCGGNDTTPYVFMLVWPLLCCLNAWLGFFWRRRKQ